MQLKRFTSVLILPILIGCASQPPIPRYAAPEGTATANLRSEISGADGRYESIDIYVSEGACGTVKRKKLFYIRKSKSDPNGYVKVAANQPLRLEYIEQASGGRSCHISLEVNLEEGKTYSLVGGFAYKAGPIPILTDTRMCRFGVQDDTDKMPVPYKTNC